MTHPESLPRKVALLANCLMNQNAKVCEGARYRGLVNPVVEALRSRGYELQAAAVPRARLCRCAALVGRLRAI